MSNQDKIINLVSLVLFFIFLFFIFFIHLYIYIYVYINLLFIKLLKTLLYTESTKTPPMELAYYGLFLIGVFSRYFGSHYIVYMIVIYSLVYTNIKVILNFQ